MNLIGMRQSEQIFKYGFLNKKGERGFTQRKGGHGVKDGIAVTAVGGLCQRGRPDLPAKPPSLKKKKEDPSKGFTVQRKKKTED